jgi:hypothetical protein
MNFVQRATSGCPFSFGIQIGRIISGSCKMSSMNDFQGRANWQRNDAPPAIPGPPKALIPPLIVALVAIGISAILYRSNQSGKVGDIVLFYSYALLPHVAGLLLLIRTGRSLQTLAAGFLFGFWALLGAYLLLIGLFIFSVEYPRRDYQLAWLMGFAFSAWMIVSGFFYRRSDRSAFSRGVLLGFIFAISGPLLLAILQRSRH